VIITFIPTLVVAWKETEVNKPALTLKETVVGMGVSATQLLLPFFRKSF
jgi:hypothetical protein